MIVYLESEDFIGEKRLEEKESNELSVRLLIFYCFNLLQSISHFQLIFAFKVFKS